MWRYHDTYFYHYIYNSLFTFYHFYTVSFLSYVSPVIIRTMYTLTATNTKLYSSYLIILLLDIR